MNRTTCMGMGLALVMGLAAGLTAGGAALVSERRERERLEEEVEMLAGDLTALRVEAQWDRFEQDRGTAEWQGGGR
jgi:hypothetical protein